jgi:hypothetical protein
MRRFVAALCACLIFAACGPHRITYIRSSMAGRDVYEQDRTHANGIGPFLAGGGGYFGVIDEMSPALIDYTGPMNVAQICPDGFYKVSHHHSFGESVMAGCISWVIILNAYHESKVEFTCLRSSTVQNAPSQRP